jgi:hypothetical protein
VVDVAGTVAPVDPGTVDPGTVDPVVGLVESVLMDGVGVTDRS